MIFVVPASTDHLLWTMAIKTPDAHNHSQETERDQLGVTRKSPEPFSASGWLPVALLSLTIADVAGLPSINVRISYCSGS